MRTADDVRAFVAQKIKEKKFALNDLSIKIGMGNTYLFQYLKRNSPKTLDEKTRKPLAYFLDVNEDLLIDDETRKTLTHLTGVSVVAEKITSLFVKSDNVVIDIIDATACCGNGIENLTEKVCGHWKLPIAEYNTITTGNPNNIKMLRVQGDSMQPTINDGDWVWVDISNNFISSDGMYLIKMHTGLAVKRLQSGLNNIKIKSDNPTYSDITADIGEINIIGKVVYILNGRRV